MLPPTQNITIDIIHTTTHTSLEASGLRKMMASELSCLRLFPNPIPRMLGSLVDSLDHVVNLISISTRGYQVLSKKFWLQESHDTDHVHIMDFIKHDYPVRAASDCSIVMHPSIARAGDVEGGGRKNVPRGYRRQGATLRPDLEAPPGGAPIPAVFPPACPWRIRVCHSEWRCWPWPAGPCWHSGRRAAYARSLLTEIIDGCPTNNIWPKRR